MSAMLHRVTGWITLFTISPLLANPAAIVLPEPGIVLPTPAKGIPLTGDEHLCQFGAQIIAGWYLSVGGERGFVYVLSGEVDHEASTAEAAGSLARYLALRGNVIERITGFHVLGTNGEKLTLKGPGNGRALASLGERYSGERPTSLELIVVAFPTPQRDTTTILQFVAAGPLTLRQELLAALREVVHGARRTTRTNPGITGPGG